MVQTIPIPHNPTITYRDYTKTLSAMRLLRFPREVGTYSNNIFSRSMCKDYRAYIWEHIANYKTTNVYISSNSYYDFDEYQTPTNILFSKTLMDLDTSNGHTVEDSFFETKRLSEWFYDNRQDYSIQISGGGFHFIPQFQEKVYTLDGFLNAKLSAYQTFLQEECSLKTLNIQTAEPRRMMRSPYSINHKPGVNRWCIPLPYGIFDTHSFDDIIQMSENPTFLPPENLKTPFKQPKIKDFLDEHKIKISKPVATQKSENADYEGSIIQISDIDVEYMTNVIFGGRNCVRELIKIKNPPHIIRLSACSHIREHFNMLDGQKLFDVFANGFMWNDRNNAQTRIDQVKSVYQNKHGHTSCQKILSQIKLKDPNLLSLFSCDNCQWRH